MATNTYASPLAVNSKTRFWNKIRSGPKPKPRRKRHTSDSALHLPASSDVTLPSGVPRSAGPLTTPTLKEQFEPEIKYASEEMSLSRFASQHQNSLPQQVMVTDGVYWKEHTEVNISNSEKLNVYFVRHRESVKIREFGSKVEYSVPVTSTLEFGPVYNPYHGDVKDALRGFVYPTVTDLIKVFKDATIPKLITATSNSSNTTPGDCVTKGELLVVKEVLSSTKLGYRQLKVFSVKTKTEKFLHEQCCGNFTTKPEVNKLSLFSIIKYFPHSFPLCVKIFSGSNLDFGDEHYPSHLFEKVIQICRTFTDVLLVACSVPHDSVCDGREPFEIPQEVGLSLRVIELGENDHKKLRENGQQIMRNIQGDYIKQYRNAHQDMAKYVVQEMFLKAVGSSQDNTEPHYRSPKRRGGAGDGGSEPTTPQEDSPEEVKKKKERNYPNVTLAHEGVLSRVGKLEQEIWSMKKVTSTTNITDETNSKKLSEEIEKLQEEISEQGVKVQEAESAMKEAQTTTTELKSLVEVEQNQFREEIQSMSAELVALRAELEDAKKEQSHLVEDSVNGGQIHQQYLLASPVTAQRNRDIVYTLTAAQVIQLLVEVGVDDLELIRREKITGDILMELNEDELESELRITRKIHRLKVMKVINGSKPITEYLSITKTMDSLC